MRRGVAFLLIFLPAWFGSAPRASAAGDFDGEWSGIYQCDKFANFSAWNAHVVATVKDDVMTIKRTYSGGSETTTGEVDSGGAVNLQGTGFLRNDKWPVEFTGHFNGETFSADGREGGGTPCHLGLMSSSPAPGSLVAKDRNRDSEQTSDQGGQVAPHPQPPPFSTTPLTPSTADAQTSFPDKALSGPVAALGFDPGRYFALVIGNNDYKSNLPKLKTAIGDATAVGQILSERYGFAVTLLSDASRHEILSALAQLKATLRLGDNLLIFYAGHGFLDEESGRGYWLPIDAELGNNANWISTVDLADDLRAMDSNHVIIVADSCYSGTLTRDVPRLVQHDTSERVWLTRMERKRSRTALTSGGLEPVIDGGGSGHSVFTKALLNALGENVEAIDGQSLFSAIKRPVILNSDQTPTYSDIRQAGHDGGDFIFVPAALRGSTVR